MPQGWPYAVEIRNKEFLGTEYFRLLARHNVAHVFNAWTRMPTLSEQIAMPEAFTADFTVVRALLQKGRGYEKAVSTFEPCSEVKGPDEATRDALREIVSPDIPNAEVRGIAVIIHGHHQAQTLAVFGNIGR